MGIILFRFSFIVWMLLSVLTCGLLMFWLSPYMAATRSLYYEKLKEINEPSAPKETAAPTADDILASLGL